MIYGYARVSTRGQTEGNSLEEQRIKLAEAGAEEIFSETYTGTKVERPELDRLKKKLKAGDTIIVTKLDRLARSATKGAELVSGWIENGINVHILNMGLINNSPTGKLIMNIMFAFSEFERDMIVERTQEGKALAKLSPDYREGRPKKYGEVQIAHAVELLNNHSYTQVAQMTGISKSTLFREKRKQRSIVDESK